MAIAQTVRKYKDLDLNFNVHPVTKDINRVTDENAVIASLKNLLFTNFYERLFQPSIGSDLRYLLFENLDTLTAGRIERAISETIKNYEPRVRMRKIIASPDPDRNAYSIMLEFYVVNRTEPIQITFFLERVR